MPDRMDIAKTNNFMQINRSSFREITTKADPYSNFSPCSSTEMTPDIEMGGENHK